ncbi:MAG TPA: tetratricopeptide repeat protein, partial [Phycisphaerae bacterium]|nr:tetratricopeptide repeat protein [Phycisphaerae bacterium]
QRLVAMERRERAAQIQQAVETGRFQDARAVLLELERRIGGDEETRKLAEYIEAAAGKAEAEDVAAATKQAEDLMSLTSWDRAMRIAEDLIDRHPNSLPAKQLLARIQREKQVHQQEHRNRLYVEIQRHTSRREWQQALAIARQLIAAYPESIEAESLRTQMETLTKNAEIEHRRELETKYKGLIEQRNFAEALALAREVIATYPESPQARVMREQIPHLERHVRADFARRR